MSTNLALDPKLVDQALEVSGERTKKAAVTKALQEYVARRPPLASGFSVRIDGEALDEAEPAKALPPVRRVRWWGSSFV